MTTSVLPKLTVRFFVVLVLVATPVVARSQVLPIKSYNVADGLAHNNINQIFQDSKGYLWFATGEGLSRFDGYTFRNYDSNDGLPGPYINDLTADRNGRLWVAINDGGIARLLDSPAERGTDQRIKFASYGITDIPRSKNVGRIVFDADNRLWCATEAGVFRARSTTVADNDFELVGPSDEARISRAAFIDSRGHLWFGLRDRLMRVVNGETSYFDLVSGGPAFVNSIIEDGSGKLLSATSSAVYEFVETEARWVPLKLELSKDQSIETIHPDRDGSIWIGTSAGVINLRDGVGRSYTKKNGLSSDSVTAVFADRDNGLWFGTFGGGVNYRTNRGVVRFADPILSRPYRFTEDGVGNVYVQTGCSGGEPLVLVKIDDDHTTPVATSEGSASCRRTNFLFLSDGRWLTTPRARLEFLEQIGATRGEVVEIEPGNAVETFIEIYQDKGGKIWLSASDRNLYVADGKDGHPTFKLAARDVGASMMFGDSRGVLWLGHNIFLGRLRDGVLAPITGEDAGVGRQVGPRSLFEDSKGRFWIGTRHDGVLYTDDPEAEHPRFSRLTTADGLPSNAVWAIGEDWLGNVYFGTNRGVVRYTRGGAMRRLTSVDGMSESLVNAIFLDSRGRVWVGSEGGVARFDPGGLDSDSPPPPIFVTNISVEGESLAIDETGITALRFPDLGADQNTVSLRFVGLTLKGERSLTYSYKLEGSDREWSTPSAQREVNLVNLGPGSYRFLVKAIDQRGVESVTPAVVEFQILAPVWQRWWFICLAALALAALLSGLYRYRMSRVLELERVRTRIATDLHDDIGSNLTRIALMSEVLDQQGTESRQSAMLPSIANIARESVASMNDIVWAISPEHDRVLDLTRRMRQHAEEVFTIRDIDVRFVSASSDSELKLSVGVRRDVLLIFKEAINNAARHSGCTQVEIDFECSTSRLFLRVVDNGLGFEKAIERDGHGLASMERRAKGLGGNFQVRTSPGDGTKIEFDLPL